VTRFARIAFVLLIGATFGGFFVAQKLKQSPRIVRAHIFSRGFSPNGDGLRDRASIRFQITKRDEVTLALVDSRGDVVRRLLRDANVPVDRRIQLWWDGRTDGDVVAPDGYYRVRVTLRRQGRSVFIGKPIKLDTIPPTPVLFVTSPGGDGPAIARPGSPIAVRFTGPHRLRPSLAVWRLTAKGARLVRRFFGHRGSDRAVWDGHLTDGSPAPAGLYVIAVRLRDDFLNGGTSPILRPADAEHPRGRPGVTMRLLAVTSPLEPVRAGISVPVQVAAFGRSYKWILKRDGRVLAVSRGEGRAARLRVRTSRKGRAGIYVLTVKSGDTVTHAPILVSARHRKPPVLVVVPAISWQGRNTLDDDGDGLPNSLLRGGPASVRRPFAGNGLPPGFADHERPLLATLDKAGLRYDLTSDLALARNRGPQLSSYRGVVLAGNPRFLPLELARRLRVWVERGGHVLSLGAESLRRYVKLSGDELSDPTSTASRDIFGARVGRVENRPITLLAFGGDELGLFAATGGQLGPYGRFEPIESLGAGVQLIGGAGEQEGEPIFAAARIGKGFVIRTGLPQWSVRLPEDRTERAVMERIWTLLGQ
jgi:hypothetical protein